MLREEKTSLLKLNMYEEDQNDWLLAIMVRMG